MVGPVVQELALLNRFVPFTIHHQSNSDNTIRGFPFQFMPASDLPTVFRLARENQGLSPDAHAIPIDWLFELA
jgi:hypothetical protein